MHFETDIYHRQVPKFVSWLALLAFILLTYYIVKVAYEVNVIGQVWSAPVHQLQD